MKYLFILILTMLFISCDQSSEKLELEKGVDGKDGDYLNLNVNFTVSNQKGEDMLNSSTPGYYKFEDITIYYLVEGKKTLASTYNAHPTAIRVDPSGRSIMLSNPHMLTVNTYPNPNEGVISNIDGQKTGRATTLIEYNEHTTDTLITEWLSGFGHFSVRKAWYNGEQKEVVKTANFEIVR